MKRKPAQPTGRRYATVEEMMIGENVPKKVRQRVRELTTYRPTRKLTAREAAMKRKHTRLFSVANSHSVRLVIENQSFTVNDWFQSKEEAEWTRDMLAIALAKIEP